MLLDHRRVSNSSTNSCDSDALWTPRLQMQSLNGLRDSLRNSRITLCPIDASRGFRSLSGWQMLLKPITIMAVEPGIHSWYLQTHKFPTVVAMRTACLLPCSTHGIKEYLGNFCVVFCP